MTKDDLAASAEGVTPRCCWCQQGFARYQHKNLVYWACTTPSCHERQLAHGISWGGRVLNVPLPKQVDLLDAVDSGKYRWILIGGAAGGTKSHSLRWLAYHRCLTIPRFKALLLRRTYPELEKTHMREAQWEATTMGAKPLLSKNPPVVEYANGSITEFGHCQDRKHALNYLSAEYDLICFDELVTFEEEMVLLVGSRARTTKPGVLPMVVCGSNPGGAHARWVKDRFIDKTVDTHQFAFYHPDEHFFIPAQLDDNPYLDAGYLTQLLALPRELRDAYRLGRWDIFPGQYFDEFRREKHCQVLTVPDSLPRLGGFDWGYAPHPSVMLWAVMLPDGRLYIEREAIFRKTVAKDVAEAILADTRAYGLSLGGVYADPSIWTPTALSGESIAETMQRAGLALLPGNHDRINGWQRLRHWLRDNPADSLPWMLINPQDCPYLVKTLPNLVHDDTHPEDLDTTGEDDPADALRYLVMGRPAPWIAATEDPLKPEMAGWLLRELQRENLTGDRDTLGRENVRF